MKIVVRIFLAAILLNTAAAFAQAPKKPAPSPAVKAEFEGFMTKFRAALKANDPAAVAALTKLPFMNDEAYSDAAKFRANVYPNTFTRKNRACIQRAKATYQRDGLNQENYTVICGEDTFTFTRTPAGFLFTETGMND